MNYDLVIVGGGINGAALLREAAARDLTAILFERRDYGSGSTSRSSRLLHCGLRYLAPGGPATRFLRQPGQFLRALNAARRGMQARNQLCQERPHLLRPIRMMFPLFEGDDIKGWQVDAAFALLSRLGGPGPGLDYRRYRPGSQTESLPFADALPQGRRLKSLMAYTEYQIDVPERLCLDLIQEARALGATARNYAPVQQLSRKGELWQVTVSPPGEADLTVAAKAVVNLAGPWVDQVAALTGAEPAPRMVANTRGGHVVVQLPERFEGHGVMTLSGLDHPFYCFPFRDRHFLGPTEAPDGSDPDMARTTPAEVVELLGEATRQLPGLGLGPQHIIGSWAGMRPLTLEPKTMMAARNRTIHPFPDGDTRFLSLTNGSIGAHRITACDILDRLGHGARAVQHDPVPYRADPDPARMAGAEQVRHLEDLIWRRMGLAWDRDAGHSRAAPLARQIAPILGWDDTRVEAEIAAWTQQAQELGLCQSAQP